MRPSGADLDCLGDLIRQGALSVVVDRVFGFDQIADAFGYLEQGHAKGKVIVTLA